MNMELLKKLQRTLETSDGNPLDIHYALYKDFINQSESPEQALRVVLEYPGEIGDSSDDTPSIITDGEVSDYLFEYYELVKVMLRSIIDKNLSSEDFYKNVYTNIFKFELLPQNEKGQAILLYLLSSKKIPGLPYHQAENLLIMDEEHFREIIDRIDDKSKLGIYMLNRRFKSKTEEVSQLWEIANQLESREEQIVFWVIIISAIRRHENNEK